MFLLTILGFLAFVSILGCIYFRLPEVKGELGEKQVDRCLLGNLPSDIYKSIFNLIIPDNRGGTTQIDQVVVSPYGIFVLETKNWSGWIFGSADSSQWTKTFYHSKYHMQNPFRQNFKHVACLASLTHLRRSNFIPAVVLTGDCEVKTMDKMPDNLLCSKRELLNFIKRHDKVMLSAETCEQIYQGLLSQQMPNTAQAQIDHLHYVNHIHEPARSDEHPCCPRCGTPMVLRTVKTGPNAGKQFWGCSNYPRCKGTLELKKTWFG